ncbi:hypothetical protein ACGFYZ_27895 [Streptomyces sp. NPDC048330]|uniref:hypothetical protein n=1 Tax=Streptomyces sp. NPDC048330 TaxID=3365533 RepID=UPI0037144844
MTTDDGLAPYAPLWQAPSSPPRWVIWHPAPDLMVFDTELNLPVPVDDTALPEVVRRMRHAGAPETDAYPGRPCG